MATVILAVVAHAFWLSASCGALAVVNPDGLDVVIAPWLGQRMLAGAVVLVTDRDGPVIHEAAGFADIAAGRKMAPDSLFWIASLSKPMTAAALLILVDEGRVRLDEPVATYLPEFGDLWLEAETAADRMVLVRPARPITVRDILSHTSGLPFKSDVEEPTLDLLPLATMTRSYASLPLLFEPGTRYEYSNAGINTAGRIIEVVAGMPYEDFMAERLFKPLGMNDTTFRPTAAQCARLATSYVRDESRNALVPVHISQLKYPLDAPDRWPMPGGGLFSTAADCGRFCRMLLGAGAIGPTRILSEASVQEMRRRQTPQGVKEAYGLGCQLHGDGTYGHGGAFATEFTIDDARGRATVWLVQDAGGPTQTSGGCRDDVRRWLDDRRRP